MAKDMAKDNVSGNQFGVETGNQCICSNKKFMAVYFGVLVLAGIILTFIG